ncbi:MAG: NAD(P)/FAD-dependent oxidoreductase [Dehalococcoidia bacterium]|nr:NAD(P)/FAD-dependent oxidoreductase [Dehalococcoidia bacterium]
MVKYDVVIVGGGPGGCSAALNIHRLDPDLASRTLVLEKHKHPREKLCGGGVTRKVDLLLAKLGLGIDVPSIPLTVHRFTYRDRHHDFILQGWVKVIRRDEFDAFLARVVKERGMAFHEEEEVVEVRRMDEGLVVATNRTSYQAKVVIAADGVHSVVRRSLDFPSGERLIQGLVIELPANSEKEPAWLFKSMINNWDCFDLGSYGYYWEFPILVEGRPYLQCGLYSAGLVEAKDIKPTDVFRELLKRKGINLDDHKLKGLPERGFDPEAEFSRSNVLLIGEAAGIDSLTGEGISQAIEYGELAAESIVDAFCLGNLSFSGYKDRVLGSRMGKELRSNLEFARRLFSPDYESVMPERLAIFGRTDTLEKLKP